MRHGSPFLIAALLWALAAPRDAHAYLDPSTGSMAISAVMAVLAAIGMAIQTYGQRLRSLLLGGSRRRKDKQRRTPAKR
jgi:hypothetical protein